MLKCEHLCSNKLYEVTYDSRQTMINLVPPFINSKYATEGKAGQTTAREPHADHFMRPAGTYKNINSYRESSRKTFCSSLIINGKYCRTSEDVLTIDFFFALPISAALGFTIFSNVAFRVKSLLTPVIRATAVMNF